jgi:hypothetical protein
VLLSPDYARFNEGELPATFGPMHMVVAYNELLHKGMNAR